METETNVWVRWKGVTTGPFSKAEILRRLSYGEIGLYHEVFLEGAQAQPLRHWVAYWNHASPEMEKTLVPHAQRERITQGYLWCGLCFLFPPLLAIALLNAQGIESEQKRKTQRALAAVLTLSGTFFWILLAAAW